MALFYSDWSLFSAPSNVKVGLDYIIKNADNEVAPAIISKAQPCIDLCYQVNRAVASRGASSDGHGCRCSIQPIGCKFPLVLPTRTQSHYRSVGHPQQRDEAAISSQQVS